MKQYSIVVNKCMRVALHIIARVEADQKLDLSLNLQRDYNIHNVNNVIAFITHPLYYDFRYLCNRLAYGHIITLDVQTDNITGQKMFECIKSNKYVKHIAIRAFDKDYRIVPIVINKLPVYLETLVVTGNTLAVQFITDCNDVINFSRHVFINTIYVNAHILSVCGRSLHINMNCIRHFTLKALNKVVIPEITVHAIKYTTPFHMILDNIDTQSILLETGNKTTLDVTNSSYCSK